jgi:hypothetical protein
MRKKYVFGILLVLVVLAGGAGGYVYLKESTKPVIHQGLSERSREFIASQKSSQSSSWQTVNLTKKRAGESDFDSNRVTVKDCYSLIVPFQVADDRQNDPCVYYAILESPRGSFTTSLRSVGFSRVEDAPDVTFRRSKKDVYHEADLNVSNQPVLVFTDTTGASGRTAFMMIEGKVFTLSMNIAADEATQMRQIRKILESVEIE